MTEVVPSLNSNFKYCDEDVIMKHIIVCTHAAPAPTSAAQDRINM